MTQPSNIHLLVHFLYLLYSCMEHISLIIRIITNNFISKQRRRLQRHCVGPSGMPHEFCSAPRGETGDTEVKRLDPGHTWEA